MRSCILVFLTVLVLSLYSSAQVMTPGPSSTPITALSGTIQAAAIAAITQTPTPVPAMISVAAATAPPQWLQDLIIAAQSFPIVGPYLTKIMMYIGVIGSILTALVAFLLTGINILSGIASFSGLGGIATVLMNFKNGPIMYWITYFSNFNAQKPAPPALDVASAIAAAPKAS